jgi:hypothetical protein
MGNNSYLPVLGHGTAIISLNGQQVLVRHVLHVPGLAIPLYSLCAHLKQHGCSFWGHMKQGCWCTSLSLFSWWAGCWTATFPTSLLDGPPRWTPSAMCNHAVLHRCTLLISLLCHARSPRIRSSLRMTLLLMGLQQMFLLQLSHNQVLLWFLLPDFLCCQRLSRLSHLLTRPHSTCLPCLNPSPGLLVSPYPAPPHHMAPVLLSTITCDEILKLLHHSPAVCPCDTPNNSDTKTHWSAEEIHWALGCQNFWNYKHILQVSWDGAWVDGGEFPPSLGSFATIPKAKRGQSLDHTCYLYLDAVHLNITFGDCLAIGGLICPYSGGQGHLLQLDIWSSNAVI